MLPASNRGAGMSIGFPDVCLTPAAPSPVPIPYPNLGMNAQAAPFSAIVKLSMMPALNMGSAIPMTSGDEGGTAHPMIKQRAAYTMGNPIVYVEMLPAINLLCPTTGNNMNNALGAVLVPSVTNVFFTCAPEAIGASAGAAPPVTREGMASIARAFDDAPLSASLVHPAIALLRIRVFSSDVPRLARNAMARLERDGARAFVFDLRGCPGGDVDAFARLAEDLLPEDALLATRVEADGDETALRARGGGDVATPLVVVVDGDTASAAELFAGCLAAHGRATLVGARTLGKTSAHRIAPAGDEPGARYVPVARFLLPDGRDLAGAGLDPDVPAAAAPAGLEDAALTEAIAIARRASSPVL